MLAVEQTFPHVSCSKQTSFSSCLLFTSICFYKIFYVFVVSLLSKHSKCLPYDSCFVFLHTFWFIYLKTAMYFLALMLFKIFILMISPNFILLVVPILMLVIRYVTVTCLFSLFPLQTFSFVRSFVCVKLFRFTIFFLHSSSVLFLHYL